MKSGDPVWRDGVTLLFKRGLAAAAVTALIGGAALADDFEDSVAAALDAYRAGDFKAAKEEIDFASQILSQMRAAQLEDFLPEPLDGWERRETE